MKKQLSVNDLKAEDRRLIGIIEHFSESVLTDEKVDEYIETNISGKTTRAIYSDVLKPFMEFLREQTEYFKVDFIIDCDEKENK